MGGIKNASLQEKKIGEKSLERGKTRAGERQSSAGHERRCRPSSQKVCPSVSCGTAGPPGQRRSRTLSGGLPSSTVFTTALGATDAEDTNSEPTQLSPDLNVTSTTALCLFDSQALETTSVGRPFYYHERERVLRWRRVQVEKMASRMNCDIGQW